jgi:hypothetical protein
VKALTRSEAESKRQKAVEFLRRIGRDDDADLFEAMDAAEYAEHKGAELIENPTRRFRSMAIRSVTPLESANDQVASAHRPSPEGCIGSIIRNNVRLQSLVPV